MLSLRSLLRREKLVHKLIDEREAHAGLTSDECARK
jgi:hypothetical protein